jgi:hypothetical protein
MIAHIDNVAARLIAERDSSNSHAKHIDISICKLRDLIHKGIVSLRQVPTLINISDMMTKALPPEKLTNFSDQFSGDITPTNMAKPVSFACIAPLRLLVLFSGTASVEKACRTVVSNCVVISVDNNTAFAPTYLCDIRDWQKTHMRDFKPGHFDIITASPPCTEYSRAKTTGVRNLKLADSLVKCAMEIISYFNPKQWMIENPVGLLQTRPFMQKLAPFMMTCTYCKYGAPFRKATNIWASFAHPNLLKVCDKHHPCYHMARTGKHPQVAQSGPSGSTPGSGSAIAVYPLPERLVRTLITAALSPTLFMALSIPPTSTSISPEINPATLPVPIADNAAPAIPRRTPPTNFGRPTASLDTIIVNAQFLSADVQRSAAESSTRQPAIRVDNPETYVHNIWTNKTTNTWTFNR